MSFWSAAFAVALPVSSFVNCIKEYDLSEEERVRGSDAIIYKYTLKPFGYSSYAYIAIYLITGIVPTYFNLIAKLNKMPTLGKPFTILKGTCLAVQLLTLSVEVYNLRKTVGSTPLQDKIDQRVMLVPFRCFLFTMIPTLLITSGYLYTKPVCRAIHQKIIRL